MLDPQIVNKSFDNAQYEEIVTDWKWFAAFVKAHGLEGNSQYERWLKRRGKTKNWENILTEFKSFKHKVLYEIEIKDVKDAIANTTHALGKVNNSVARHKDIHNFSPPFPMIYIFHAILERIGRVPVWNDVKQCIFRDMPHLCWIPFCEEYGLDPNVIVRDQDPQIMGALIWRIGNAFYSWIREVDLLVYLRREHNLDVRYHFLVDAEWRADFVYGTTLLELYIKNKYFKDAGSGRKVTCQTMNKGYRVLQIAMETGGDYGKPWTVSDSCKLDIVKQLKSA